MGAGSPVPSLDIRRGYGQFGAESAIPGLDIDPPSLSNSGPSKSAQRDLQTGGTREGIGGWISNMVKRHQRPSVSSSQSQYRRIHQGEEGDEA
jgi:hypothetical protein